MILRILATAMVVFAVTASAEASDTKHTLPIAGVTENPSYQPMIGTDVKFFFADQPVPKIDKTLGEYVTNRKTNSFAKSDENACQWAFLSALLSLRQRAKEEAG